jgi:hypothetical protein
VCQLVADVAILLTREYQDEQILGAICRAGKAWRPMPTGKIIVGTIGLFANI